MRVGVMVEGQEGLTWDRWFRLAEAAEQLGYESLVRSDHLTSLGGDPRRPSLETWTSLTALATRTHRIRFGPLVSPLTFYHPAILAKMAAAVDGLSGGRLDLASAPGGTCPSTRRSASVSVDEGAPGSSGVRRPRDPGAGEWATRDAGPAYFPLEAAQSHPRPPAAGSGSWSAAAARNGCSGSSPSSPTSGTSRA